MNNEKLFEILMENYMLKRVDWDLDLISTEELQQLEDELDPLFMRFIMKIQPRVIMAYCNLKGLKI